MVDFKVEKEGPLGIHWNNARHLLGMFYRNIAFLENGIKPIWVFDGKPPENKKAELNSRKKLHEEAKDAMDRAEMEGNPAEEVKQAKRSITVTQDMVDEAKKLLEIMGIPVVQAKSEAEAQCAVLNKQGVAVAVSSEDLDSLPYGAGTLLRKFKNARKPAIKIELDEALKSFELTQDQFIDLCILCGSDYTPSIKGIGPANALKFIQKYGTLEASLEEIKQVVTKTTGKLKYEIPENYNYKEAVNIFRNPDAFNKESLKVSFNEKIDRMERY